MLENASSVIVPAAAMGAKLRSSQLITNAEHIVMLRITAITVEVRIRVSFQDCEKATQYAAISVNMAVIALPTLVEMPSRMRFVSAVIWFVISPLPRVSKKA